MSACVDGSDLAERMKALRAEYATELAAARQDVRARPAEDLVSVTDGGLAEDAYAALRAAVAAHARLADGASKCLGESFDASSGFVVRFRASTKDDGLRKLHAREDTRCLAPRRAASDAPPRERCDLGSFERSL